MKQFSQLSFVSLTIFLLSTDPFLQAVDIGSDTAVTRFNTQVLVNDGDRIAGFAGLNAGFQLFDSNVTALFDSFFTVDGDVELSSGQLNLNQDLILSGAARLFSLGTIAGNQRAVKLAPVSSQNIPSGSLTDCAISLLTEATFSTRNVVACDWSVNDQYISAGLQPNVIDELQVYEFLDKTSLVARDSFDVGNERVASTSWHPTELFLASGNNSGTPELRIFEFDGTTLTEIQNINFAGEVRGVKYHPTGDYLAATSTDNAQEIVIYPVNGDGTLDTGGAFTINLTPDQDPDVHALDWNVDGSLLAVGLQNGTNTVQVYEVTFGPLSATLNATLAIGQTRGVNWNNRYPNLLATAGNTNPQFRIYEHDSGAGTLTLLSSIAIGFSCFDVAWNKVNGECLALGIASNPGTDLRTYFWNNTANTLTEISAFDLGANNTRQVVWSRDGNYLLVGSNDDTAKIYRVDAAFQELTFSNLNFYLNGNVSFGDCRLTFTGTNTIHGNTNTLTLLPTCTLKIAADASLQLKDIRVIGVRNQAIELLDSTSTLTLKDCIFELEEAVEFNQGRFDVIRQWELKGDNKSFSYTSDQVSTIFPNSRLTIDSSVTFSYRPSISANNLLLLQDESSIIRLQSGTIATSNVGLNLTTGTLQIDGNSFLSNEGANTSEAISFGDGSSSTNNLCLEFEPAAQLQLLAGFLSNDNIAV